MAKKKKSSAPKKNGSGAKGKSFFNRNKNDDEKSISFLSKSNEHLQLIKPKEKYAFHSDYYKADSSCCVVEDFFHTSGADQNYGPFWSIAKIPSAMDSATTINFEQIERMSDGWIREHQSKAEMFADKNIAEQETGGTLTNRGRAYQSQSDMKTIAGELLAGASYLNVQSRLMIKAPSLKQLDQAVEDVNRLYTDRFGTLRAKPYIGQQRQELYGLFRRNSAKNGKGFYFTSTEYAGAYMLVTHGLEDPGGEYVGTMIGDINSSAVLFDVNRYANYVIVATSQYTEDGLGKRTRVSDMWGSKISQAALMENGRVVHLILNGAKLDEISPEFPSITTKIDMSQGDLNIFEIFGDVKDEKTLYSAQIEKLVLMTEQLISNDVSEKAVLKGVLRDVLNQFYIDSGMWVENAAENAKDIRVVGIPHEEVPRLKLFVPYLSTYRKAAVSAGNDQERIHALNVLESTFTQLLRTSPDLFNTVTTEKIDNASKHSRIIYDFANLARRGKGVAMAQFVNVIGFAIQALGPGDLVVIHGAQLIVPEVREYVMEQIQAMYARGGRAAFLYDSVDAMLDDQDFTHFDDADYLVLGYMRGNTVNRYEKSLGTQIAPDLKNLIEHKSMDMSYIRRGFDNVVFSRDLQLTIPEKKSKKTRKYAWRKKNRKGGG